MVRKVEVGPAPSRKETRDDCSPHFPRGPLGVSSRENRKLRSRQLLPCAKTVTIVRLLRLVGVNVAVHARGIGCVFGRWVHTQISGLRLDGQRHRNGGEHERQENRSH